ncbi:MAG: hypothetical protein QM767_02750 [Anaeromyxobacter sp.]
MYCPSRSTITRSQILAHLPQLVGDVDHRHAAGLERPHLLEEQVDLVPREHGGGLVQDQQPGVEGQRLGDLHHLLLRHVERGDPRGGVDLQLQPAQQLGGAADHGRLVEQAGGAPQLAPEEDVLVDVQVADEVELLRDEADAQPLRVAGGAQVHLAAVQQHPALGRRVDAGEDS